MVHSNDLLLRSKGLAVIAIPLVPLLVIAIWLIVNVRQERQAQGRVAHTLEVRAQIASVLGLLVEQEAAVRGFLLTGSADRSEEHTSELQSLRHLVCRLL